MLSTTVRTFLALLFLFTGGLATAAPWTLHQVLKPPAQAGYGAFPHIGFGNTTALSEDWLAVSAPFGHCPGTGNFGSVLMYRYDVGSGQYEYTQQLCHSKNIYSGFGQSVAIWRDWMIVGSPRLDFTPADSLAHGGVTFFRFNGRLWQQEFTAEGAVDSLMGYSVAMDGGVAVAGEHAYQNSRGRVRSWRLVNGTWVNEGWIFGNLPASPPNEAFGANVALDIRQCRAPTCTRPLDAVAVLAKSGLYTFERTAFGWGTSYKLKPEPGTATAFSPVALNDSVAVAAAIMLPSTIAPCPVSIESSETRVMRRESGSARLRPIGFSCRDRLKIDPLNSYVSNVDVAPNGGEFYFSVGDYPADRIGVASNWVVDNANDKITPVDFVTDPDYTSQYYAQGGGFLYVPELTGDYFGKGLSVQSRTMAVGAPFYYELVPTYAAGYVVIYRR